MKKAVATGLLLVLLAVPLLYEAFHQTPKPQSVTLRCDDLVQGCRAQLASGPVEVKFSEAPVALKPFHLLVSAPQASRVYASFDMVGMDMGFNRYEFAPDGNGLWRARVILPMCVTGRRDWVMTLTVDRDSIRIPFSAGR